MSLRRAVLLLGTTASATTDIASWQGLRGAQVQDKIVLEGGIITTGTYSDGAFTGNGIMQHSYGVYYQINLNGSIDTNKDNTSDYMIAGLPETSNTQAPNYIGGGLFCNDYQFYTFGGLADKPPVGLSTSSLFSIYPSNPSVTRFAQGVSPDQSTAPVNDNITSGAYASSPDQGLGFYFSGMVSANRSELEYNSDDTGENHPTITSPTFIKVDMTTPDQARYQYMTWPNGTTPRAEGALVWVPYGKQGSLIAIGGVQVPGDLFLTPPNITADGPFMTELAIYDIDADAWHTQQTLETGERPNQLASFCTATVPTQDNKAHEIFVYGGYDGTYTSSNPNVRDDVWVLSIPAFQWTKVLEAPTNSIHGRQGSVCFTPNPTTMMTIGGTGQLGSSLTSDTIIDVLDLNTLTWTGRYDASSSDAFVVPSAVVKQLNYPDDKGPGDNSQVTGLSTSLNNLFSTPYQGEVKTYYPYASASNGSSNGTTSTPPPKHKSNNDWKIPVIATLCTVLPTLLIAAIIFCCVRRRQANNEGVERTKQSRRNVFSWMHKSSNADPLPEKSLNSDLTYVDSDAGYFNRKESRSGVYEAPSSVTSPGWRKVSTAAGSHERYEIMDREPLRSGTVTTTHSSMVSPHSGAQEYGTVGNTSSKFSETFEPTGYPSIVYELPHERSNEDLPTPAGRSEIEQSDVSDANGSARDAVSATSGRHLSSPSIGGLPSPENRAHERPSHHRNMSSLSSDIPYLPALASPDPDEDKRRSKQLEILPDIPASPVTQHDKK